MDRLPPGEPGGSSSPPSLIGFGSGGDDVAQASLHAGTWLDRFLVAHPPSQGPPRKPPLDLIKPALQFTPAAVATEGEVDLLPLKTRRSRPIREAWQGRFQSRKLARTIPWRSQLVFEFLCHCEVDPSVTSFAYRPVRVDCRQAHSRRSYTPDVHVLRDGQSWFVEVTWEADLADTERVARWAFFGEKLSASGLGFMLLTERQIRAQPRHSNVFRILRALPAQDPPSEIRKVVTDAMGVGGATVAHLVQEYGCSMKQLMRLVLIEELAFDLNEEFGPSTRIYPGLRSPP